MCPKIKHIRSKQAEYLLTTEKTSATDRFEFLIGDRYECCVRRVITAGPTYQENLKGTMQLMSGLYGASSEMLEFQAVQCEER